MVIKINKYADLKTFCNSLSVEQLKQEVYLSLVDDAACKIESAVISEEDQYYDHCDGLGTLDDIKLENPDDWEDVVADATLVPKGSVYLINE